MKIQTFFYFCGSFLTSCPATQINADPCGSGSETLLVLKVYQLEGGWGDLLLVPVQELKPAIP
jgi:hypothetical protein